MYCARHPKVETALSCSRCSTPICPQCAVSGAVGMICKKCAFGDGNPLFKISPGRLVLSITAGLVVGIGVGFLIQALSGAFFMLFIACPIIGGFLGQVILWTSGHKRGRVAEMIAGGSVVLGALLSSLIDGALLRFLTHPIDAALFILTVVLTAAAAIGKIRYLV